MSSTRHQWMAIAALIGCGQLIPTPALAAPELHNVTYIARVDGMAPNAVVTFMLHDNQTNSADLNALPGQAFEANTVLADPTKAGMQVRLQWPYSTNVHCEIQVDDVVTVQSDRYVNTWVNASDPLSGVMQCGAPLTDGDNATAR